MKLILHWIIAAVAIGIAAYILPGVTVTLTGALILAVVLGALNLFIRPLLVVLTLPINILTLGLFTIVINAFLVWVAAMIVPGFVVTTFWWALLFAVVLALVNWVFHVWSRERI
jgi:putative membrane protein